MGNDNRAKRVPVASSPPEGGAADRQWALALSQARILLATRAQFELALRNLSLARLGRERPDAVFLHTVEQNVDDAIYAIGRDGSATIEEVVRRAIDDIVNEASQGTNGAPYFAD
jgi:hypothetical protein